VASPLRISRMGFVNTYLVEEDDGLTVVDTMLAGNAKKILAAAERTGRPIVRILLTHAHGDHIGSLDALAERLPEAEVAMPARDARIMAGDNPAPGHTPGHAAFIDTRDRTLFCADAYSTLGGVATSARPNPRFPLPAMATWHRPTALESARKLRALEPVRLAPGHGKVVEDPGAAMDAAIRRSRP
jgi:glyoxylase-like metal-dependent hydrolase (beta-lactamase superfamily II)